MTTCPPGCCAREYRVVAGLADPQVPVTKAVTLCEDDSVLGATFAMVAYVPGRVVRSDSELQALGGRDEIEHCVDELIRVLADLHAVNPAAVGLADFGKPDGYLERPAVGRPVAARPARRRRP